MSGVIVTFSGIMESCLTNVGGFVGTSSMSCKGSGFGKGFGKGFGSALTVLSFCKLFCSSPLQICLKIIIYTLYIYIAIMSKGLAQRGTYEQKS